ncbi:hypothetical protein M404DRAFT_1000052 [Pisolithus tinctorius Marx 270]|uniref:Uncharacterized protein n=1 Tax=Pisolithus tinctorius Marx 270 TaxID=870435 RepID=A0A0C3PBC0_PISTI|nr:hypothetical protein M404DRAFT_1000052 [Pisolithus tinctorius Marx 270]
MAAPIKGSLCGRVADAGGETGKRARDVLLLDPLCESPTPRPQENLLSSLTPGHLPPPC